MLKRILLLSIISFTAIADPLEETRYCGAPVRDSNGVIVRSSAVLTAFKRIHPCPATMKSTGACKGWSINHSIPLACGGCDSVSNLTWMPNSIKSCSGLHCIDRFERKINAANPPYPDTANCVNEIVQ